MSVGGPSRGSATPERGLALREAALGPGHVDVAADLGALGALFERADRLLDAETAYRRALAVFETALGSHHYEVAVVGGNLALLLARRGKTTDAEVLYRRALAGKRVALGADHPDLAVTLHKLGVLLADTGRAAEAWTRCAAPSPCSPPGSRPTTRGMDPLRRAESCSPPGSRPTTRGWPPRAPHGTAIDTLEDTARLMALPERLASKDSGLLPAMLGRAREGVPWCKGGVLTGWWVGLGVDLWLTRLCLLAGKYGLVCRGRLPVV